MDFAERISIGDRIFQRHHQAGCKVIFNQRSSSNRGCVAHSAKQVRYIVDLRTANRSGIWNPHLGIRPAMPQAELPTDSSDKSIGLMLKT